MAGNIVDVLINFRSQNIEKARRDIQALQTQLTQLAKTQSLLAASQAKGSSSIMQQQAFMRVLNTQSLQAANSMKALMGEHSKFSQLFGENSKANIAMLFKNKAAYSQTAASIKKELGIIQGAAASTQGQLVSLAEVPGAKLKIMGRIFIENMNRIANHFINLGKQAQWVGRQMMVGITLPMIILGKTILNTTLELKRQQAELQKYFAQAGISQQEFSSLLNSTLQPAFERLSEAMGLQQAEITQIASLWVAAGFTASDLVIELTEMTTQLAAVTQGDLDMGQAYELIRSIMSTYRLTVEETRAELEKLQLIQSATAVTFEELGEAIPIVSSAAKLLGIDVSEVAAILTGMRQKGVEANQAAHALKFGLVRLAAPTKNAEEAFASLTARVDFSIKSLERLMFTRLGESRGIKGLEDLADLVSRLTPSASAKLLEDLFGSRQVDRMTKALQAINEQTSDYNKALEMASDEARAHAVFQEQLNIVLESASKRWDRMRIQLQNAAAALGELILPAAERLFDSLIRIVEGFNNMSDTSKQFIVAMAGIAAALGPVIYAFGQLNLIYGNLMKIFKVGPLRLLFGGIQAFELPIGGFGGMLAPATMSIQQLIQSGIIQASKTGKTFAVESLGLGGIGAAALREHLKSGLAITLAEASDDAVIAAAAAGGLTKSLEKATDIVATKPTLRSKFSTLFKGLFGATTVGAYAPASEGEGLSRFMLTFRNFLPMMLLFSTVALAIGKNWKKVWEGMSIYVTQAQKVISGAISRLVKSIVNIFVEEKIEDTSEAFRKFGSLVGRVILRVSKWIEFLVDLIGPTLSFAIKAATEAFEFFVAIFTFDFKSQISVLGGLTGILLGWLVIAKVVRWFESFVATFKLLISVIQTGVNTMAAFKAVALASTAQTAAMTGATNLQAAAMARAAAATNSAATAQLGLAASARAATLLNPWIALISTISIGVVGALTLFGNKANKISESVANNIKQIDDAFKSLAKTIESSSNISDVKNAIDQVFASLRTLAEEVAPGIVFREAFVNDIDIVNQRIEEAKQRLQEIPAIAGKAINIERIKTENYLERLMGSKQEYDIYVSTILPELKNHIKDLAALDFTPQQFNEFIDGLLRGAKEAERLRDAHRDLANEFARRGPLYADSAKRHGLLAEEYAIEAINLRLLLDLMSDSGIGAKAAASEWSKTIEKIKALINRSNENLWSKRGTKEGQAYRDAFEDQLNQLSDRLIDVVLGQFHEIGDARIEAFDRQAEAQIDAIDRQIDAIEKLNDKEDWLQRQREYRRRREELQRQMELNSAISFIEKQKAINEGRFDDARMIALQAAEDQKRARQDIRQLDEEHRQEIKERRRQQMIDALNKQKELLQKQLDLQRKMLQKQIDQQRVLFRNLLDELAEFRPKNERQWEKFYQKIIDFAEQNGINMNRVAKQFTADYGMTIEQGLKDAAEDAKRDVILNATDIGNATKAALRQSLAGAISEEDKKFFRVLLGFAKAMESGQLDKKGRGWSYWLEKITQAAEGVSPSTLRQAERMGFPITRHQGGPIGRGYTGKEIPIVAQEGEYIINKQSARAIGPAGLNAINSFKKYHQGGYISDAFSTAFGTASLIPATELGSAMQIVAPLVKKSLRKTIINTALSAAMGLLQSAAPTGMIGAGIVADQPRGAGIGKTPSGATLKAAAYHAWASRNFGSTGYLGPVVRTIGDTGQWSQHAYGNAVDMFNTASKMMTQFTETIRLAKELDIAHVIHAMKVWSYNRPYVHRYDVPPGGSDHMGHVHADFLPQYTGTPPGYPIPPYGFKTGGIVRFDTPALIHAGETVVPEQVTKALSRAGASPPNLTIQVNFDGPLIGDETAYRRLHSTLEDVGRKIMKERGYSEDISVRFN